MAGETLRVVAGPAAGLELPVTAELLIGRSAEGPGALAGDPQLSRGHARLLRTGTGDLLIEDLGSTNGTRVNGMPTTAIAVLHPGDRVELGGTTLEVIGDPATVGVPAHGTAPAAVPAPLGPLPRMSGSARAGRGDADGMRATARRQLLLAGLLVLVIGALVAVVATTGGGGGKASSASAAAGSTFDGTVFVESNSAAPNSNSVLAFRYRRGSFKPLDVREYPTGGSGAHDLSNSGVLDAEQQLVTNADRTLLFAPNAGSDTVAVFHIAGGGALTPVKGSPFPSGGKGPASVGVSGNTLFVANKAQDGVRNLKQEPAGYASFHIGSDGALTPIGTPVAAPAGSSPTEAYVVPHGGRLVFGAEEKGPRGDGPLRAFTIGADGLHQAPGSPVQLDRRVFAGEPDHPPSWPQGLIAHPRLPLLYAGVANVRKLIVYSYTPDGRLSYVSSQVNKGTFLPCWTEINSAGTRLYTGNAGSQNISVFDIGTDPRHPRQIQRVKLHGVGLPWNFQLDPSGRYLFMVNMRAVSGIPAGRGNTLHSFSIGADGRLTELPSSPVPIPVAIGTNPWGLAVVPRR